MPQIKNALSIEKYVNWFANRPLRTKLIVAFLVVSISSVVTVTLLTNRTTSAALAEETGANLNSLANSQALATGDLLARQVDALQSLSLNRVLRARVNNLNAYYTGDQTEIQTKLADLDRQWVIAADTDLLIQTILKNTAATELLTFRELFPDHVEVFITDQYGALVAATNRTSDYYQADEAWWQAAYNEGQGATYISLSPFDESSATLGLEMAVPLYDKENQIVIGILKTIYRLTTLNNLVIATVSGQRDLQIDLLLPEGQILAADGSGLESLSPDTLSQLQSSATTTYAAFSFEGVPSLVSQAPVAAITGEPVIADLNWKVIAHQDQAKARAVVAAQQRAILLSALLIAGLAAIAAVGMAQWLTRPITRLTAVARRVSKGDLQAKAPVETRDEIGHLAQTFNNMTAQLRVSINFLEQQIEERRQTEKELRKYRGHLEELVEARTAELQRANDELAREIAERVRAEEALRKAKETAEEARRAAEEARRTAEAANRAKSTFLANMSHELRTPLNAILGFTQIMERDPTLSAKQRESLGVISRSGEHLLGLINDVLELSKIEAGRSSLVKSDFDLHRTLDSLEEMIRDHAENKALTLTFERAPDVPRYVKTDEGKLRQVLINLLGNAIKFTRAGSVTLRVVTDRDREKPLPLFLSTSISPISICFEVEDTGPGIAPEEMDQLFEAFVQTESGQQAQTGTGLGLPISREFVRLMGGNLTAQSQIGQGATFTFDIQVEPADVAAIEARRPARHAVGLEPGQPAYRILIVEDWEESRLLLRKLLEPVGFTVREAVNGQEAIELYASWQPHLIWMDMRMPVMDGYEATRRIRESEIGLRTEEEAERHTPVIALTASVFAEEQSAVLDAGCDDFVRKPFQEAEIFDKIAQHLGVRYVYEEPAPSAAPDGALQAQAELTPADLAGLSVDWVADLHHAAIRGKSRQILDLLDQLPPDQTALAEALAQLVHEFRFDKLVALTEQ